MFIEKLKIYAGDLIFKRGLAYYRQGKIIKYNVTQLGNKHHQIRAVVMGSRNYSINLIVRILGDSLHIENYCSCPYDWSELCKHEVAVLYKFLSEEYREHLPENRRKPVFSDGVELLKQVILAEKNSEAVLSYRLKGLGKLAVANFKLTVSSEQLELKELQLLIDEINQSRNDSPLLEKILNKLSNFDRLVIGHLSGISNRKDPKNTAFFFSKSLQNLDFILLILANRRIILEESGKPLQLGEKINPEIVMRGNESHLSIFYEQSKFDSDGYYHPELDCILKDNILHQINTFGVEQLPVELDIPPKKLGQFLFEVLPELQARLKLEVPPELAANQLTESVPKVSLNFDFQSGELICRPELNVAGETFQNVECLKLASKEVEYTRSTEDRHLWQCISPSALQEFLAFFESNNFTVSPEGLTIKNQDHLLQFMLNSLGKLPPDWQITTSPAFDEFKITPFNPEPSVEINVDGEIDWFDLKIQYNLGGKTYSHQELLRMIRRTETGGKYIRVGNQVFLIDDFSKADLIEENIEYSSKQDQHRKELYNLLFYRQLFTDHGIKIKGNSVYNQLEKDITETNLVNPYPLPEGLVGELRHYQKEGYYWLRFLAKYNLGGILADDMGLGKTLQVLTLVKSLVNKHPSLIVCPRSLIHNWAAEIDKFYPGTRYLVYHGSPEERASMRLSFNHNEFIITTYDILARDAQFLSELRFFYCILDEAQHIKNYQTQRAKEVKKIKAVHKLAMTGTPIENSLEELWSIFDFLMSGYLGSRQKFTAKFTNPVKKAGDPEALKLLKEKIAPFMLRRRKEDVLQELPAKVVSVYRVDMTKLQEDAYRTVLQELQREVVDTITHKGWNNSRITVLAALTKLRQICNHPRLVLSELPAGLESGKIETLLELIGEAIASGHKIVVFSQFVKMLKIIESKLQEAKVNYEYLDGSTRDRMERINHFNENPHVPVFLISLKAGGVGINLTSADIVIHVDPWWNPMTENQATDRVHRMGQQKQVMVYKLITMGTVEEKILQLQKRKKSVFDALIENNQSPVSSLTWEDIKDLFEL